jgi:UDP-N-acetylmuramyl pentapeptide synthase
MHCNLGMPPGRGSPKIAVLDTIHGAAVIAQRMADCGLEAEALEVYHHSPSIEDFDLVAAPVHLPASNPVLEQALKSRKRIITHHQAVGELLMPGLEQDKNQDPGLTIFEITGTHSKTSTALLLARILSFEKTAVSHTSSGLEIWQGGEPRLLQKGLSITPGNVIPALDAARSQRADVLISEISLGGTGLADFAVLTSFKGDYLVAKGRKWASTAKLQMLSLAKEGARLAANTDTGISPDISFGRKGMVQAGPRSLAIGGENVPLALSPDLDFPGYETAITAAAAAASAAGCSARGIAAAMEGFDGFSGRMKVIRRDGCTIFDSSNSGLKVMDVRSALDRCCGSSGERLAVAVVAGEDSETVCEGMDVPALVDLLRQRRDEMALLVPVGERLASFAEELKAETARSLSEGFQKARACNAKSVLLCVKCFR